VSTTAYSYLKYSLQSISAEAHISSLHGASVNVNTSSDMQTVADTSSSSVDTSKCAKQRVEKPPAVQTNGLALNNKPLPGAIENSILSDLDLRDLLPLVNVSKRMREELYNFIQTAPKLHLLQEDFAVQRNNSRLYVLLSRARQLRECSMAQGLLRPGIEIRAQFVPLLCGILQTNASSLRTLEINWILPLPLLLAMSSCSHLERIQLLAPPSRIIDAAATNSLATVIGRIAHANRSLINLHLYGFPPNCVKSALTQTSLQIDL